MACPVSPTPGCRSEIPPPSGLFTLSQLVRMYRADYTNPFDRILQLCSTVDFICGEPNAGHKPGDPYIKNAHQRRMPSDTVEEAAKKLDQINISDFGNFDEFVDRVASETSSIPQFGQLAVYDFCFRKAFKSGMNLPERYVYAACGARRGALLLKKAAYLNIRRVSWQIPVDEFPAPLRGLGAAHIENFLCVMRKCIEKIKPIK